MKTQNTARFMRIKDLRKRGTPEDIAEIKRLLAQGFVPLHRRSA